MSFTVTRLTQTLVTPAEPTPAETLPLSALDSLPGVRHPLPILLVFRHGAETPLSVIRDALAKALVYYYPVAGRFVGEGKSSSTLLVDCNDRGAWLAEARADCTLEGVKYLDYPWAIPLAEFFAVRDEDDDPLLLLQVTKFNCGGVVIGADMSHAMVDGTGLGQVLKAVAELARGLDQPTIKPVWLRDQIGANPQKFNCTNELTICSDDHYHHCTIDISMDYVDRIKREYAEKTGQKCTTFDVSAASIWQGRTRAIGFDPDVELELMFGCNGRGLAAGVLPSEGGYYGNFCYGVQTKTPSKFISNGSIVEVVELVCHAKAQARAKLGKPETWRSGECGGDSSKMIISYEMLVLSDWTGLGYDEVDFGWGTPVRVCDASDAPGMPFCVTGLPSPSGNCKRAKAACVKEEHAAAFLRETMKFIRNRSRI